MLCNSTKPCVKWNEGTCTQKIKCLEKSCDESILTNRHLAPGGVANSEYLHGEIVPVSCIDGYTFTNDGSSSDTVDITCWNGNWKDLPTCRRFADCQLSPVSNGNVQIDGRTVNPGSQGSILLNHGLTAT